MLRSQRPADASYGFTSQLERVCSLRYRELVDAPPFAPPVESRAHIVGQGLLARIEGHRPRAAERLQDWLLTSALSDERFRTRMLRFVDVFAAVHESGDSEGLHRLIREYFHEDFPAIPRPLRWMLRLGRDPLVPSMAVGEAARRGVSLFANRFIVDPGAGATRRLVDELAEAGRYPSFDLLGEAVLSELEADQYQARYLRLIDDLRTHPLAAQRTAGGVPALQLSLKLSSLTYRFTPIDLHGSISRVEPRLTRIAEAARVAGIGLCIDAEQYETRDVSWGAFTRVFGGTGPLRGWDGAAMVVQGYLRDADAHLDQVLAFARDRGAPFQVRLVKGAYWDYERIVASANRWPSPVFEQKAATDHLYERLLARMIEHHGTIYTAVASHNPRAHAIAEALADQQGLPPGSVEHQTLHRTLQALSEALAERGWVSRDYVPVGELIPGMAYLVRRILENSSQAGFLMHSRSPGTDDDLLTAPVAVSDALAVEPDDAPFERAHAAPWFDAEFRRAFTAALDAVEKRPARRLELPDGIAGAGWRTVRSPSNPDGPPLGEIEMASPDGAATTVQRARAAADAWGQRPLDTRAAILRRAADQLLAHGHELAALIVCEGGRDRAGAWAEVEEAVDFLRLYSRSAEELWDTHGGKIAPRGVVAVIPPWNFSLAIPCGMTAAALVCGNATILKPAQQTPLIAHRLVELFRAAGLPEDVLQYLPGEGESTGAALVEHQDVAMIAFTGSRRVGTWIHEAVARAPGRDGRPRALVAEMGGKNAAIVFSDSDLDEAVAGVLQSAFGHAGQKCSAVSRVLVDAAIVPRFRDRLIEAARSWRAGPATEAETAINPVIDATASERLSESAERARQEGRVCLDQFGPQPGSLNHGPLIVEIGSDSALSASTATEELFGPILALIPFEDDEDAYRIANGTDYALTAGVFSRSPSRIARATAVLDAGGVYVNRGTTGARPGVEPFGGMRFSGTGPQAGSAEYLWAFVRRNDEPELERTPVTHTPPRPEDGIGPLPVPWFAPLDERLAALARAATFLADDDPRAAQELLGCVAASRLELVEHPSVQAAGQDTRIAHNRPLGVVAVAARGQLAVAWLGATLAAGNGVLAIETPALDRTLTALREAGVPDGSLRSVPGDDSHLNVIAAAPGIDAVAIDGGPYAELAQAIGPTPPGQINLKMLLSPLDGLQPGETGFIRRFVRPRVIAIRTLRHGADLEFAADG